MRFIITSKRKRKNNKHQINEKQTTQQQKIIKTKIFYDKLCWIGKFELIFCHCQPLIITWDLDFLFCLKKSENFNKA